jgi:putative heme-binding domain-containing protein
VDNTFTGDAGGNLVHRKILHPDGVMLVGKRPADETNFEFLASRDTWFRPVNFANAPDGCLYVIDMYREVIEHPWSIPEEIKQHLDLNSGNDRGRIYRIVPENFQRRPKFDLGQATTAELVATLEHPNGWHRDTAARLLYERQDKRIVPSLQKLARQGASVTGRIHALYTLTGLHALTGTNVVNVILSDPSPEVRKHAILLSEQLVGKDLTQDTFLSTALRRQVADDDATVRFQLALTLGEMKTAGTVVALAKLAESDAADPWISAAILSARPEKMGSLFRELTRDQRFGQSTVGEGFLRQLIQIIGAKNDAAEVAAVLKFITAGNASPAFVRALGDGLQRAGSSLAKADTQGQLKSVFASAEKTATDTTATEANRTQAVALLALTSFKESGATLASCLSSGQPEPVQLAAINALGRFSAAGVGAMLLKSWTSFTPRARSEAITALLSRPDRATALLRAIEAGTVPRDQLNASQIEALQRHKDKQVAALAAKVLPVEKKVSREEILRQFNAALTLKGDAAKGRAIYAERCLSCHVAGKEGHALGPDLVTVKTAGRERLLTSIIDPNKEIAPQYLAFNIETRDGESFTGVVTRDDAGGVTLRQAFGREDNLARAQIKSMRSPGQSLMPEDLQLGLTPQQMADLLTFIEELK